MYHATGIILVNMGARCNMKIVLFDVRTPLCDISTVLYKIGAALCDVGALGDIGKS